jgi:hypothetical protein
MLMSTVTFVDKSSFPVTIPEELKKGKRNLTEKEIAILIRNRNVSIKEDWSNVLVTDGADCFDPDLIMASEFNGFVVLGKLRPAVIKFHDLELSAGIYNSSLQDVVTGDNDVIHNVSYLCNYRLGNGVMLFNIQEMSCTKHSKFGNGILKEGEPESNRIWIGVGNENGKRAVLPFAGMIPADAFIWSRYRDDTELMQRFIELTEYGNTGNLDTCGVVEDGAVIKNTTLLKDAFIGNSAYIKGAFKLKNITVLSSAEEESQIGEGVEMVNGIMGYGSRVFYQAVAVRFVLGRNCQLKYGARLLNSVLGDNSTISCCELLNNLIFPFHEQHHNSSFLIATTICGQSNIAAGATIGSNHNSRSPDGEIYAGRGFWPGLSSDFKHNSRFASFILVSKGSYQHELNIIYPFSLVAPGGEDKPIHIVPAYWFLFNMFAIARNKSKFRNRDRRVVKVQHIETDPIAPDSIQEVMAALDRLIELTGGYLKSVPYEKAVSSTDDRTLYQIAKDYLHQNPDADFTLLDMRCQKKYGAIIYKPVKAYKEYRRVVKYFAARTLVDYCRSLNLKSLSPARVDELENVPLYTSWVNAGGQVIPEEKLFELFTRIKSGKINCWDDVHAYYDQCDQSYLLYKARYSLYLLEQLYSCPLKDFSRTVYLDIISDVTMVSTDMYHASISSREKDFTDFFRKITFRNEKEMTAVLGTLQDNEFLRTMQKETDSFNADLQTVFSQLC